MQIRCRHCQRPYSMQREDVTAALDEIQAGDLKFHNSHCPHCGKTNQISKGDLKRAAPTWKPAEKA